MFFHRSLRRHQKPSYGWRRRVALLAILLIAASCISGGSKGSPVISVVAGQGTVGSSGDNGSAIAAQMAFPSGVAADNHGNVFVADTGNHRVRRIDTNGRIHAVAGTGRAGFSGDGGPAVAARLSSPGALAVDGAGNLYIADKDNDRIRKVDAKDGITTVAGNGSAIDGRDGVTATETAIPQPVGVAVDRAGQLLIAEANRVRIVDRAGIIASVAGGGAPWRSVEREPATSVDLGNIGANGLAADRAGNFYIAYPDSGRIDRVDPSGNIELFAGDGTNDHLDTDGPATKVSLKSVRGIASDGKGSLFIAEAGGARIRRVNAKGIMSTVARNGSGPGDLSTTSKSPLPVEAAALKEPEGLAVEPSGSLLVVDSGHNQVRQLSSGTARGVLSPPAEPPSGRPAITELRPARGGGGGQMTVEIVGTGFNRHGTTVRFGERMATIIDVLPNSLLVTAPRGQPGDTVNVVVTTRSGRSAISPATRFSFTESWEPAAPLTTARYTHTATLLDPPACNGASPPARYPCGTVLVAGGSDIFCIACDAFSSTEIYDARMNNWRPGTKMIDARMNHTATLLPDGRVLVVGGKAATPRRGGGASNALTSAEIYDPGDGSWTKTGDLAVARWDHTATLLDGPACGRPGAPSWCHRVLVVGGDYVELGRYPLSSAELWDPLTGTWSPAGELAFARANHTATSLPDGRVMIVGGLGGAATKEPAPTSGSQDQVLSSVEIYDPMTNSWSKGPEIGVPRYAHTATVLRNGFVLVVGGIDAAGYLSAAELFDPVTSQWRVGGIPLQPRGGHTATLLADGRVLVAGGGPAFSEPGIPLPPLTSAEIYDPVLNSWTETRPLNAARTFATAILLDGPACRTDKRIGYCGTVLLAGGGGTTRGTFHQGRPIALASTELYRYR